MYFDGRPKGGHPFLWTNIQSQVSTSQGEAQPTILFGRSLRACSFSAFRS
ncbi:hypothetical protein Vwe01_64300 [Micromonospora andamanensis]|nr:hypothetical protein Vwe01_64300 [Micromonospora andamanensis]